METLRQNSRLIDLYNLSATKLFQFCMKYKCKKEFRKISETLHTHYLYIVKSSKSGELVQNNYIPYPVTLKDDECTTKLLEMRQTQLEYALKMEEWSDAYRISNIIFYLINRKDRSDMKQCLENFYTQLAKIFWKSKNYLFHTYALLNLLKIVRSSTTKTFE